MNIPEYISKNLTAKECFKSNTATRLGVSNNPTQEHLDNIVELANNIFQPMRDHFGVSIGVTSVYRSAELNEAVNGAKASQHLTGHAMDIDADVYNKKITIDGKEVRLSNSMIFNYIKDNLEFDTLIWEFGDDNEPDWVHVSYVKNKNRKRILVAYKDLSKKTNYKIYG